MIEIVLRYRGQRSARRTIVARIRRLGELGTRVRDDGAERPLEPGLVGVVCAHVSQVNTVRERLPRSFSEVLVETADRFQGLERSVIVVYHPLSGRADADQFHMDSGRTCVALSGLPNGRSLRPAEGERRATKGGGWCEVADGV